MNIKDMRIGELLEISKLLSFGSNEQEHSEDYPLDKNVIVRTVTMIYTGRLVEITKSDFVLVECSWIPETERYMQFVAEGADRQNCDHDLYGQAC